MLGKEKTFGTDQTDKSLCLDLTLAVHRWVHTEVEGKRGKKEVITPLKENDQLCIETSSGHKRQKT